MKKSDLKNKVKEISSKENDKGIQIDTLMSVVDYVYELTGEIKATAIELGMHPDRVKKLLITSEKISYTETAQIQRLQSYGMKMEDIQKELNLKKSALNSYLPYSKVPYKKQVISANAERCDLYRRRKEAVSQIKDAASLMIALMLFQDYTFAATTGRSFKYVLLKEEENVLGLQIKVGDTIDIIDIDEVLRGFERIIRGRQGDALTDQEKICIEDEFVEAVFKRFNLLC